MIENKHTPEPLTYMELPTADGEFMVLGGIGPEYGLVALCARLEDARRIVACVNACAGIPSEVIEQFDVLGAYRSAYDLEKQRYELLVALERFGSHSHGCSKNYAEEYECDCGLSDAISSVKSGASTNSEEISSKFVGCQHHPKRQQMEAALLWTLYNHQGGSSHIGQPIRKLLGIGQYDHLSLEQIAKAKAFVEGGAA